MAAAMPAAARTARQSAAISAGRDAISQWRGLAASAASHNVSMSGVMADGRRHRRRKRANNAALYGASLHLLKSISMLCRRGGINQCGAASAWRIGIESTMAGVILGGYFSIQYGAAAGNGG